MLLLARSPTKPAPPRHRAPPALHVVRPAPVLALVENCVEARLAGAMVAALPGGALWIEAGRTLVVADLHFEKGSAFAKRGQMLPPYDTRATLERLAALIDEHEPEIVVSLGDAFHDGGGPGRMGEEERAQLQGLMTRADWVWVEGNHEGKAAETLGGVAKETLRLGALTLRHAPTGAANEVAGHLHPCAKVAGHGRSVRRRCFAYDGERMVLPAFGAFTGGLNIRDEAFASVFPDGARALVLGKDRVLPVMGSRLLAD
jgi:DNA ligase-associated metallophosphoesterase